MSIWLLGVLTLVVAVAAWGIAVWLGRRPVAQPSPTVPKQVYGARQVYFVVLIVGLAVTFAVSMAHLPYPSPGEHGQVQLDVTGRMWAWDFGSAPLAEDGAIEVPVDQAIEFRVTSGDVNHGFGIYSPSGHLLSQTQAMPGYTNRLLYTFRTPGDYHIMCMEYCGLVHHGMTSVLRVR